MAVRSLLKSSWSRIDEQAKDHYVRGDFTAGLLDRKPVRLCLAHPISVVTIYANRKENPMTDQRIAAIEARYNRYDAAIERYEAAVAGKNGREAVLALRELQEAEGDCKCYQAQDVHYLRKEVKRLREREKAAAPGQAPESDVSQSPEKQMSSDPEHSPQSVPIVDRSDKPTDPKESKMDLRAELEQCKAEAAEQMKELIKGHGREIAPEISMEPDR